MKKEFIMVLDEHFEPKLFGYSLYRSLEKGRDERPIIDGLYIQREEIGKIPPIKFRMTLEKIDP